MTGRRAPTRFPLMRVIVSGVSGALIALLLGLLAVALAPDNGFADLAFASVTKIFLMPLGLVIGATIGWRTAGDGSVGSRPRVPKRR